VSFSLLSPACLIGFDRLKKAGMKAQLTITSKAQCAEGPNSEEEFRSILR